ncbi:hypothetical protein NE237_025671 [Protea cynaroides]|uniref:Uncharacterized protein n=1 Tax=Protea cynaroides TaxID=273540 RepID=A0A9Q0H3H4_9MAGN|nr:hypothetical protein NE237_025671 [Protea cynaroides]
MGRFNKLSGLGVKGKDKSPLPEISSNEVSGSNSNDAVAVSPQEFSKGKYGCETSGKSSKTHKRGYAPLPLTNRWGEVSTTIAYQKHVLTTTEKLALVRAQRGVAIKFTDLNTVEHLLKFKIVNFNSSDFHRLFPSTSQKSSPLTPVHGGLQHECKANAGVNKGADPPKGEVLGTFGHKPGRLGLRGPNMLLKLLLISSKEIWWQQEFKRPYSMLRFRE